MIKRTELIPIRLYIFIISLLISTGIADSAELRVKAIDSDTREPLQFVAFSISGSNSLSSGGYSDNNGIFKTTLPPGTVTVNAALVGYKPTRVTAEINDNGINELLLSMQPNDPLSEVIVTARESRNATSASIIDTTAMQHLQPSSFSDLLELLPGNVSKDPSMGSPNVINLRTATNVTPTDDYLTSAMGTSFIVDGVPVNTNANMQTTTDGNHSGHATVAKGVDMRALATDEIEKVEIVRGIASVEYGELTSGLVNIKRKSGVSRLEARFKADTKSQLFYVGKGFNMPGNDWIMNAGVGYLDAKIDPRNARENYKRINASLRSDKRFNNEILATSWNSSLNYTATFERDNNDPDLSINNTIDRFSTTNHSFSWNNTLSVRPVERKFFTEATLTTGVSYSHERLHQERHVSPSRVMPMTVSLVPGSNYVNYLPMLYLATLDVKGDPLTIYVKGAASFRYVHEGFVSGLKGGVEWNMSKNYGDGNVYDLERPITASTSTRPRAFKDIPAMHQLSAYVESRNQLQIGNHTLEATVGLRETQLLHLDSRYTLANKPYFDPRGSLTWILPAIYIAGQPLVPELNGGIGLQTKMPVAAFLYPEKKYYDFEQLNYYHNVPEYRTMNVMTYIEDVTNYNLKAARNLKWEVRGDLSYKGNRLSVTYFREKMSDGFRHTGTVRRFTYNRYDASGFDPVVAGHAPRFEDLPAPFLVEYQQLVSQATNGSSTRKEGVEYTFQSRRIPAIKTRITISGAYLKTTNNNSQALWYKPSIIVNNRELQYIGLYDDTDGSVYESFNTNLMFDTDIPKLGLRFSMGVQTMWFTSRRTLYRDGVPVKYMDQDGNILDYTAEAMSDPYLSQLIRKYADTAFDKYTVPAESAFNLKATKSFWNNRVNVALYVNRLFTIQPDYKLLNRTVRRYSSPYFGMEINFKI